MKKLETIFERSSDFETPKKLNRSNKKVSRDILNKIENGLTIEDLENILNTAKLPVYKYKTQITIHGLFPEIETNYIFGYKNIFQNKNQSIGIKWTAIDESKRKDLLSPKLAYLDFRYISNSSEAYFQRSSRVNRENFEAVKSEYLELAGKIDKSLFYGNYYIYTAQYFGANYMVMDLHINGIKTENINPFLSRLGINEKMISEIEDTKQKERLASEIAWRQKREEEAKIENLAWQKAENDIQKIKTRFKFIEKTDKPGIYVKPVYNSYHGKIMFTVGNIYFPDRAKLPRINKSYFETIEQVFSYKPQTSFSDQKVRSFSGYAIN